MHEPGSRSKQTSIFMLPEDEAAFDEALAHAINGLAQWQTHDHRTRIITLHDSLPDAMRHDHTQAFLRLLGRDGGIVGPIIQYLRTIVVTADEDVLAAAGGRIRATGLPHHAARARGCSPRGSRFSACPSNPEGPAGPGKARAACSGRICLLRKRARCPGEHHRDP